MHVALDLAIVICLSVLCAIGKLDPMVVLAIIGPMVGAKAGAKIAVNGSGGMPPGGAAVLLLGAWQVWKARMGAPS